MKVSKQARAAAQRGDGWPHLLWQPLTILVLATMIACAWATDTVFSRMPTANLQRLGCGPADLFSARGWCVVTALPFTWGGFSFLGLLPLVALSLGACEHAVGAARTAAIFLFTCVLAEFFEATGLRALAPLLGEKTVLALLTARDVGPSAGCFGCVGFLIARLSPGLQASAAGAVAIFLLLIALWRPDPGFAPATLWISDLAHPLAALTGWLWGRFAGAGSDGETTEYNSDAAQASIASRSG
jgi:hypothetical protein